MRIIIFIYTRTLNRHYFVFAKKDALDLIFKKGKSRYILCILNYADCVKGTGCLMTNTHFRLSIHQPLLTAIFKSEDSMAMLCPGSW